MHLLAVFALPQEVVPIASPTHRITTLVTGVGKAQAGTRLMQALMELHPDGVINIGTAGTARHAVGDILVANRFVDRQYERLRIQGVACYQETVCPTSLQLPSLIQGQECQSPFIVNTGDDFVTSTDHLTGDAIDMECYAEALACRLVDIPFVSVKYITDILGQNSIRHWEEKLVSARDGLEAYFSTYLR